MVEIPYLHGILDKSGDDKTQTGKVIFSEDDDLDLCLYYLRTLHNVLRCSGGVSWPVVASKHLSFTGNKVHISGTSSV